MSDDKDNVDAQRRALDYEEKAAQRLAERNARNQARFDKAAITLVTVLLNAPDEWFSLREILELIGTWTAPLVIGRYEALNVLRTLGLGPVPLVRHRKVHNRFSEWQIDHTGVRRSKYQPAIIGIEHEIQKRAAGNDSDKLIRPTKAKK